MGLVRNASSEGAETASSSGGSADQFSYIADLLSELQGMADAAGARQLAALIGLAHVEASRSAAERTKQGRG